MNKDAIRILLASLGLACLYWFIDTVYVLVAYTENLRYLLHHQPLGFWDAFVLNVPPHQMFGRVCFVGACLIMGALTGWYYTRFLQQSRRTVRSEARFQRAIEHSPVPMVLLDNDRRFMMVNHAFTETYGYRIEDIPDSKTWERKAYPDPDYRAHVLQVRETMLREVAESGTELRTLEFDIVCKNASRRRSEIHYARVGDQVLVVMTDLTARRRDEEHLRRSEAEALRFLDLLRILHDTANALSQVETFDALCRKAIELGRSKLGFDRMGLWLLDEQDPDFAHGTYGTSLDGKIIDEHHLRSRISREFAIGKAMLGELPYGVVEDPILDDEAEDLVSQAERAIAPVWDGKRIIGAIATDNMTTKKQFCENDVELLALYATSIGHLASLKRAEEALRAHVAFQSVLGALRGVAPDAPEKELRQVFLDAVLDHYEMCLGWYGEVKDNLVVITQVAGEQDSPKIEYDYSLEGNTPGHTCPLMRAIGEGRQMVVRDLQGVGRPCDLHTRVLGLAGSSCIGFPVHIQGEIEGGFAFYSEFATHVASERIEGIGQLLDEFCATLTERRRRKYEEEEHQKLDRQVQHAQKLESLGVLAGGIAHDFNNLLMGILGNTDLALADMSPDASGSEHIKEIEVAARRAADLSRQMLAYSGRGRFVVEVIDLNLIVEELNHLLEVSVSKKASLRYRLAEQPVLLEADATQLRQVVMNLIINASEAIAENAGVVSITTGIVQADKAYLRGSYLGEDLDQGTYGFIQVADTGCGMDAETRERLFDPFFTTKFTGRGLGMAAVLGIVRGHQGTLRVYSEPGKGTTIRILFPTTEKPARALPVQDEEITKWRGSGRILLVDDEAAVRNIGKILLERSGFEVVTAVNGREALSLFRAAPDAYRAVLLDLTMPQMDGDEAFRELKRVRNDVRVILCSGYAEHDVQKRFEGQGIAGFIQKPYQKRDLIEKIREVLATATPE